MADLDWNQCAAVESIPGKRSGAWVFKDTRTPASGGLRKHGFGSLDRRSDGVVRRDPGRRSKPF